jgi:hypothetical protein
MWNTPRSFLVGLTILSGALIAPECPAMVALPESQDGISVQVETNGEYQVHGRAQGWTFRGSTGYPVQEITNASGQDAIGAYHEVSFRWRGQFSGSIRRYDNRAGVLFSVDAPAGANVTNVAFPSFGGLPTGLHGFSYGEKNFAPPSFGLEENGTPWLLFDDVANTAVISPAANFLVAQMSGDGRTRIASGLNPEIGTLAKPLTHRSLLVLGRGVGETFEAWGRVLTDLYGKKRPSYDGDPTVKSFGYWTDNGADYYYKYDKDLGYCGTLLKMVESYRQEHRFAGGPVEPVRRYNGLHGGSGFVSPRAERVSKEAGIAIGCAWPMGGP